MELNNFLEILNMPLKESSNAIDVLKSDHMKVKELFRRHESSKSGTEKNRLMETIINELTVHSHIEQKLVYPLVDDVDHEIAAQAVEEHHVVDFLISELQGDKKGNDAGVKMRILKTLVKQHIREEESEVFSKLRKSGTDLNDLGKRLMKEKDKQKKALSAPNGDGERSMQKTQEGKPTKPRTETQTEKEKMPAGHATRQKMHEGQTTKQKTHEGQSTKHRAPEDQSQKKKTPEIAHASKHRTSTTSKSAGTGKAAKKTTTTAKKTKLTAVSKGKSTGSVRRMGKGRGAKRKAS